MAKPSTQSYSSLALIGLASAFFFGLWQFNTNRVLASSATWVSPASVTLKAVGTAPSSGLGRIAFEDNLDCIPANYTLNVSGTAVVGCFVSTAFGEMDVRNGLVSFNGNTSTAVPLIGYGSRDVLLPRPGTSTAFAAMPAGDRGVYLGRYQNVLASAQDERTTTGKVIAKRISQPVDSLFKRSDGQRLVANFNSLAFSENGDWLIAESYSGQFLRINLDTDAVLSFADAFATGGSGYDQSQVAVTADGRYVAIANHTARSFRIYDLSNCSAMTCLSYEYWPTLASQIPSLRHPVHLRFLHQNLLSFVDTLSNNETTYLLTPNPSLNAFTNYIALGDSYTSGEGAHAYLPNTDTETNQCHNSTKSYPALLTAELFTASSGHSVACSGANINDLVGNSAYTGQNKYGSPLKERLPQDIEQYLANFRTGYLPQLDFIKRYQPTVSTISISGNDIGFGKILKLCAAPHVSRHLSQANNCYETYEDRLELAHTIDRQLPRLTSLFKKTKAAAPLSTVYAVGYPLIAVDSGNCANNVRLNTSEIALSIEIIVNLNNVIANAAAAAGISYVDIEHALAGHRLCETKSSTVAMNGVTAGDDGGLHVTVLGQDIDIDVLGKESFHPNALGYQLIAESILRSTDRLKLKPATKTAKPPAATDSNKLLQAPKTGRAITVKKPASITPNKIVKKGKAVAIKLKGSAQGLKPKTGYAVTLKKGSVVKQIGVITSNDEAELDGSVVVLPIVESGTQEIVVTGPDQLGDNTSVVDVITVIDDETDLDGDNIPNQSDSCTTVINSGIDQDGDNIDDACDPVIADSPSQIVQLPIITPSSPGMNNNPTTSSTPSKTPLPTVPELFGNSQDSQPLEVKPLLTAGIASGQVLAITTGSVGQAINNRMSNPPIIQAATYPNESKTLSPGSILPVSTAALSDPKVSNFKPPLARLPWHWYLFWYSLALLLAVLLKRWVHKKYGQLM